MSLFVSLKMFSTLGGWLWVLVWAASLVSAADKEVPTII